MLRDNAHSLLVLVYRNICEKPITVRDLGENRSNDFYVDLKSLINISIYSLQVIIEGVAGVTFASNIAVDDVTFSANLSCVSVGKPTPPETFEGNVFLTQDTRVALHSTRVILRIRRNPDRKYQAIRMFHKVFYLRSS